MRIKTLDIETTPHLSYHWKFWQENIGLAQNVEETRLLSFGIKTLGEKNVVYRDLFDDDLVDVLWHELDEADAVITWNGESFDLRHVNREFATRGYGPVYPAASIDLKNVCKKRFYLPSFKLDYVGGLLLDERKLETDGFALWPACIDGDPKALKLMKKYNQQDVRLTERLYTERLRPWVPNHPYALDVAFNMGDTEADYQCPVCGSRHIVLLRPRRTRCYAVRVVRCGYCTHVFDGKRRKVA